MSLMLRKNCQDTLNSIGLNEHHVTTDALKYLTVSCECGTPLFRVFGIQFSRVNPTQAEIQYAAELFNDYVQKHSTTIKKFLKDQAAFNKRPAVLLPASLTYNYSDQYTYHVTPDVTIACSINVTKYEIGETLSGVTRDNISKIKFSQPKLLKDVQQAQLYLKYEEERLSFNNMQKLMDSCEL